MNNSNRLVEIYSQRLSLETNQAIADKLGVKRPTVSMWKSGTSHPDAESIDAMCKATGENLAHWLPLIEAERARTPAAKKVWLRLAAASQAAALIAITVGVSAIPAKAYASTIEVATQSAQLSPVYIMRKSGGA